MGRKIKGSKHHGVKDPEKQRQVREDKIKAKVGKVFFSHHLGLKLDSSNFVFGHLPNILHFI